MKENLFFNRYFAGVKIKTVAGYKYICSIDTRTFVGYLPIREISPGKTIWITDKPDFSDGATCLHVDYVLEFEHPTLNILYGKN